MSDPLGGYTPDWRKRLNGKSSQHATTTTEEPLAGYTPDWRGRLSADSATQAPEESPASTDAIDFSKLTPDQQREHQRRARLAHEPGALETGIDIARMALPGGAGYQAHTPVGEAIQTGTRNVAAGVPKFIAHTVKSATDWTPEELRQPEVRAELQRAGMDPDALLHEAIARRAAGEPSGPIETAASVGKGMATMGYDLQRGAQGGPVWEIGADGKPHLVHDNPEQSVGEKAQAITELAGNAALFGTGVEGELRGAPISARVRAIPGALRDAVAAGRRLVTPQPATPGAEQPATASAGQAEPAAPAAPATPAFRDVGTMTPDEIASEAATLSARFDPNNPREPLPPLSEAQRARVRELSARLSVERERMAREEPPLPIEQSGMRPEPDAPPAPVVQQMTAEQILDRHRAPETRSDFIYRVPTSTIASDPTRFQFKETGPGGVTPELKNVTHWNPQLAGIVSVWRDPADGLVYVVNGHHRLELAQRLGVPELNVQFIDAPDAAEARASGAFINMAEGRGTATDVAKFLRDRHATPADLQARGVSVRGDITRDGLALSKLAPDVFDQVATGKAPQQWGVAIGNLLEDPALQREALTAARSSGKRLSQAEVAEIARQVRDAGTEGVQQETLFGKQEDRHALYSNRAQLAAALKRQLSTDRRLFGYVSREGRAEQLSRAGNTQIDVGAARTLAEHASQAEEIFDRLYTRSGPIAEAVHEGAKRIAQGERPAAVAAELYPAISEAVGAELAQARVAGPDRGERAPAPATGPAAPHEAPPVDEAAPPEEIAGEPGRTPDSTDPSQGGFFTSARANEPERIVGAVVTDWAGEEHVAPTHAQALEEIRRAGAQPDVRYKIQNSDLDEFKTSTGRTVRREEALGIARAAEQLKRKPIRQGFGRKGLAAEDLLPDEPFTTEARAAGEGGSSRAPGVRATERGSAAGPARVAELERKYGTDQALGVVKRSENEPALLPDGGEAARCTDCAAYVVKKEGRGRVVGYEEGANPTETATGTHPGGGHDFAVIDERYIVDEWVKETSGQSRRAVFDLENPTDVREVRRLYGDPRTWIELRDYREGQLPDGIDHIVAKVAGETGRPTLELRPEPEGRAGQEALFGEKAGTPASRNLAQTEAAARGDLPRLREELRLTRDPHQRMLLNAQIAQLEKLVNRAKPLTADEIKAQAAARQEEAPQVGPEQRDMFVVSAGGGRPRSVAQAGAQAPGPVNPPAVPAAASGIARYADSIKRLFAPASRGPGAMEAALNVRENTARLAARAVQARAAVATFAKAWDAAPRAVRQLREEFAKATDPAVRQQLVGKLYAQDQALQFIDRMEQGKAQPTPELTRAAEVLRGLMDGRRDAIRALGTGKLEHFIEDYFPHIWENPEQAQTILGRIMGKRPLEGPRSFLKQRSIPTVREGIEAGLVPITWNPADLVLLKLREMDRYRMGQEIMAELKDTKLARFVSAFEKAQPGEIQINDHVATVYGPPTVPVKEAFDLLVRQKLTQVIRDLGGLTHERGPTLAGKHGLGYAVGPKGDFMATRSGTPDSVIMHELGHIVDFRYHLWDQLTNIPGKTKEAIRARKALHQELRDLADLRYEGQQTTDTFKSYVRNRYEKMANAIMSLIYAPEKMQSVAPTIKARLTEFLRARPELRPLLDIKPSLVHGTAEYEQPVGGMVIVGHYYAPEPVATILNNSLSPGLAGNALFDSYRGVGNVLNQAQLGLSAFHLGFTSMDAAVSKAALGVEQVLSGHFLEGAGSIVRFPVAPIENLIRGHKLLKEFTHPGTGGPELAAIAESLIAGGGRVRMDAFYKGDAAAKFWDALHRGRYARAGMRALPAVLEYAAKPLMEWIVPRQKLGVFADLARFELARLPKEATRVEIRAAMGKAWDTVDNRMGQLVNDNLFWNKALKDLGMASVRSLGWNIGTLREIGGGLTDFASAPARALRGDRVLTHRMAYVVALPFVVGLTGGMLNYLLTGEPPKELKDYFFPRTGRMTPEGQPERVQLPSYMRDVFHVRRHPLRTVTGKLHPLITYLAAMWQNEDYFGNKIRNEHDPLVQQAKQVLNYTADQFEPIGLRQAGEEKQRGQGAARAGLSFFGVTPAAREEVRSPAENLTHELLGGRASGALTPEEAQAAKERRQMADALRTGDPNAVANIRQAVRDGRLKPDQAKRVLRERRLSSLVRGFRMLTLSEAVDVLRQADADERRELLPYLNMKAERAAQAGDREAVAKARAFIHEMRGGARP